MAPVKEILAVVKIQIPAGQASPAPPVGTALGPYGLQIMDFCKEYNARTESQRGNVVPVEITVFADRTFTFITKTPPAAELIKKAAKVKKGAGNPLLENAGSITDAQLTEIAELKLPDLNAYDIDAAKKQIAGTARQMGIDIVG